MRSFVKYAAPALSLLFFVLLLADARAAAEAARSALSLCLETVLPSLFPFFVFSSLFVSLGCAEALRRPLAPLMAPLFGVGGAGASALLLGLTGGYPVGARVCAELYSGGLCSRSDAERLLAFCNNSGPGFILGVVGGAVFGSTADGMLLYLVHVLAALLTGIIMRRGGTRETFPAKRAAPARAFAAGRSAEASSGAFINAVTSSFSGCLGICGFVLFFSVLLALLRDCGALAAFAALCSAAGMDKACADALSAGLLELTNGAARLSAVTEPRRAFVLAAFLLGFGGLSVHCQALSFIIPAGLSARPYFVGKCVQAALSAAIAVPASLLM
jgi:sporulation integral membrane protein YlbJ